MIFRVLLLGLLTLATFSYADEAATYNRINISASASGEVSNDTMIVELNARAENKSPATAANQVNSDMQWALDKLKDYPDVVSRTLNYRTFPTYREQNIAGWQVEQSLRLESAAMNLLSKLTGELQTRLNVTSMQYQASPAKLWEKENETIRSAIGAFEERALIVSNSLGARSYQIVSLRIDTQNRFQGFPRAESMARLVASDAGAPASTQAGQQSISVNVNGEIELVARNRTE